MLFCMCRHYFDMSPQIWSSKDIKSFSTRDEFNQYLSDNDISCVIGIDALLTLRLLRGTCSDATINRLID